MATKKQDEKTPTEKAAEQGFYGVEVDETPNEAYTVAGVAKGMKTPETTDDN